MNWFIKVLPFIVATKTQKIKEDEQNFAIFLYKNSRTPSKLNKL